MEVTVSLPHAGPHAEGFVCLGVLALLGGQHLNGLINSFDRCLATAVVGGLQGFGSVPETELTHCLKCKY